MTYTDKRGVRRATKASIYSLAVSAIILAVLIVINLIVYALPSKYTLLSTSTKDTSALSDVSIPFVEGIDEPITIYMLAENGEVDTQTELLIQSYIELNDNISYEIIDPIENPNFTAKYTNSTLTNGSLIVVSEKRAQTVNSGEMVYYVNEFINGMNNNVEVKLSSEELNAYYYQYMQYYGIDIISTYPTEQYYQAENLITSALDYVTIDHIPQGYILNTTGDAKMSTLLLNMFAGANIKTSELNLKSASTVPVDASCVIIYAPADDISDDEYTKLETFVNNGGSVLMMTNVKNTAHPNLMKLGSIFGLSAAEGMVRDPDANHNSNGTSNLLLPDISSKSEITYSLLASGYVAQFPNAHSITIAEELPENVTATALFYTSKDAYLVSTGDDETQLGDAGVLNVGVSATKKASNGETAKLVWMASTEAFTDSYANATSGGNYYYLTQSLRQMSEIFTSEYSGIAGISISVDRLDGLTYGAFIGWGIVIILIIPFTILISGIVIWYKRRRR